MKPPIRKNLLVHSILLKHKTEDAGNGADTEEIQVNAVRIEKKIKTLKTSNGYTRQSVFLIFWSPVDSTPATFEVGDTIVFNGEEREVSEVNYLWDDNSLHHVEVIC